MNLGSPDSTEVKDVRRYLTEFLMDPRVIDYNWLGRTLLVRGIIVPFRAPKSAEAYKSVWTEQGSPLIVLTEQLRDALQKNIEDEVVIAMRYGNPSPAEAYDLLMKRVPDLEEVILVPLYPHYAMSSYETAVVYAEEVHRKKKYPFKLSVIRPFYDDPLYQETLAESMRPYLDQDYDHVLFSYHGVPERHIRKSDITGTHCLQGEGCCDRSSAAHRRCYRHQCFVTTKDTARRLGIPEGKYSTSFQSRLGRDEWLKPYTAMRLQELAEQGVKKLVVVCPAFISDCLETLEEIAVEGREIFQHAGGESFQLIPCLNVNPLWVNTLAAWLGEINGGNTGLLLQEPLSV